MLLCVSFHIESAHVIMRPFRQPDAAVLDRSVGC